jgi:hypothetical protein
MSVTTSLTAHRDAAADAKRLLEREIAHADELWGDPARRSFERAHLASIRSEVQILTDGLARLAEEGQRAMAELEET